MPKTAGDLCDNTASACSIMVSPDGGYTDDIGVYHQTGHVMFVEKIENGYAYISEANAKYSDSISFSYNGPGNTTYSGIYHEDVIDLSNNKRKGGNGSSLRITGYIHLDEKKPEITSIDSINDADITGFTISFNATDDVGIKTVGAYVWGITNPLNGKEEIEKNATNIRGYYNPNTKKATVRVNIGTGNNELKYYSEYYYLVIYAEDYSGKYVCNPEENTETSKPYPVSIININEKDAGKYKANKNTVSYAAPAKEIFGFSQKTKDLKKGDEIEVLGSYFNKKENKEYLCVNLGSNYTHSFVETGDFDIKKITGPFNDNFFSIINGKPVYASTGTGRLIGGKNYYGQHDYSNTPTVDNPDSESQISLYDTGQCGEKLFYDYHSDGTLLIYGTGDMYHFDSYSSQKCPWASYPIKNVIIQDGVTSIGNEAFAYCTKLESIILGNSIANIGNSAFDSCEALTNLIIPINVTSIGDYAFYWCTNLKSVTIPSRVTSIGTSAFEGCKNLEYIYYDVKALPDFHSTTFKNSGTSDNGLEIVFGDNVEEIPDKFLNKQSHKITKLVFGKNVKSIGEYAFNNSSDLKEIEIPSSVKNIGNYAFYLCSDLLSVNIPGSVESIGNAAFYGCTGITDVYYYGTEAEWNKLKNNISTGNENLTGAEIHFVFSYGDVNRDGKINISDCVSISLYLAKQKTLTDYQLTVADVTGDGKVDEADAEKIAKYVTKAISTLYE